MPFKILRQNQTPEEKIKKFFFIGLNEFEKWKNYHHRNFNFCSSRISYYVLFFLINY